MIKFDTQVQELKYRVLKEVAKSYLRGSLMEDLYKIPKSFRRGRNRRCGAAFIKNGPSCKNG
jgi:hypothetical protein